jgi:S-DNA-T family DNA segregation ATPase FtsK/SpoIIIE
VLALGRVGRPSDRPVVGTAVSVPTVPRLTSEVVVRGLAALGIPGINQAVARNAKGTGWFPAPITRDGPGWRADVELPHGVTVTDVIERRDRLASGLRRPLGCVWPEPATEEHPGRLVLWVGDESLAQQKPAPWPLARRGQVDLFASFPFGQDQRGRPVPLDLMYGNLLIGSLPGAGKTMALRIPLLAAALDPTAELRIFELKGSGDLGALEQVAHHYGSGPGDETIEACLESLREVYADLTRRAATISALPKDLAPENKVIAALARKRALRLHPVVVAIDECQELFSHPDYGKEAGALCTAIIKRGRALGTILLLATQRPDKDSLPTGVSANVGIRFCLRVMGQTENDMVLGTSSYKNGLRATMFTPKDRGIGYLVGASDEPQITRTYYVDNPGAEAVAVRARALREAAGTLSGAAIGETTQRTPAADLLEDLRVVFATAERMWNEDIVTGLAELRPTVYGDWTAAVLARALRERYQIETRQTWIDGRNRQGVHAEQVHAALAGRQAPAIEPGEHLGDA